MWINKQNGEDQYVAMGSTVLFGFVVILALVSFANRKISYFNCADQSFEVVNYEPRFASGYGNIEMEKPKPNQWLLTIKDMGIHRTFTLSQDIMNGDVTNPVKLEFCYGIWGTRYLNIN